MAKYGTDPILVINPATGEIDVVNRLGEIECTYMFERNAVYPVYVRVGNNELELKHRDVSQMAGQTELEFTNGRNSQESS